MLGPGRWKLSILSTNKLLVVVNHAASPSITTRCKSVSRYKSRWAHSSYIATQARMTVKRDDKRIPAAIWPRAPDSAACFSRSSIQLNGDESLRLMLIRSREAHDSSPLLKLSDHLAPERVTSDWQKQLYQERKMSRQWEVDVTNLRLRPSRLLELRCLIERMHFVDALDWLSSVPRTQAQNVYRELLTFSEAADLEGADVARLYIENIEDTLEQGIKYQLEVKPSVPIYYSKLVGWDPRTVTQTRPQNTLRLYVRELSLNEFFHRVCVMKQVPQSLEMDMLVALNDGRAGAPSLARWLPYLTPLSRTIQQIHDFRGNSLGTFDYHRERREFIDFYTTNLKRAKVERGEQRNSTY